jgi:hypothetical protein
VVVLVFSGSVTDAVFVCARLTTLRCATSEPDDQRNGEHDQAEIGEKLSIDSHAVPPIAGDENLLYVGNCQRVLRRYEGSQRGAIGI